MDAIWSYVGDDMVPTILTGPSRYGGNAEGRASIYAQLQALAAANKNVGVADTRMGTEIAGGILRYPDDYAVDGLHYSALGQIKKHAFNADAWKLVRARIAEPDASVDEPTLTATSAQEIVDILDKAIAQGNGRGLVHGRGAPRAAQHARSDDQSAEVLQG
jgi:hypothetical protein